MQADSLLAAVDLIHDAPFAPGGWTKALAAAVSRSQEATVRCHLSHIFDKVGVHRQAELVRCIRQSERYGDEQ